ncbi:hypothetical protein HNQ34_000347 [Anoxybacillus tepidamans]|uniref:Uncharacterized protein n=1 Tax=Anoxybacteroides tepidamans TaxID=265948 RepID=A0A7W8IMJ4_9BACL|nr:hypothetical protein [Anoxybacillus tepidamans]MBB5323270.1 hypothetical protein [Anoxybacillus tepidamans]
MHLSLRKNVNNSIKRKAVTVKEIDGIPLLLIWREKREGVYEEIIEECS